MAAVRGRIFGDCESGCDGETGEERNRRTRRETGEKREMGFKEKKKKLNE